MKIVQVLPILFIAARVQTRDFYVYIQLYWLQ